MRQVAYTRLADCTQDDADLLVLDDRNGARELPRRILDAVSALDELQGPLKVTRCEHSLQSATRAYRDKKDEEYVVAVLVHDIGDALAPFSHGEYVAAVLKPFVHARICWIIEHHPVFQAYYYAHLMGGDRNARERFRGHQYFDDCLEFCEKYDQNCFDPHYDWLPLTFFEPMVHRVFGQARYAPAGMAFLIESTLGTSTTGPDPARAD